MVRRKKKKQRPDFVTPATAAWVRRVGATQLSMRKFVLKEEDERGYSRHVAWARIDADGRLSWDGESIAPTEEEKKAIEAEVTAAIKAGKFPKSIPAWKPEAEHHIAEILRLAKHKCECFSFFDTKGEKVLFVEERQYPAPGDKIVLPWSFWSDGQWRQMEPDGPLPPYGLDRLKDTNRVFIHEGAKAARDVQAMVDPRGEARAAHPWAEDLRDAAHVGWPGGTHRVRDVEWEKLKTLLKDKRVIVVADNDQSGIAAVTTISETLLMPMEAILFDGRFPGGFDLGDPWPAGAEFWKDGKYVGPSFNDCLFPATWATRIGTPSGRGRPPILLRKEFAGEWVWVVEPAVFAHEKHPDRMLTESAFNRSVRPFSHTVNTAALLINHLPSRCDGVAYDPGRKPGLVNVGEKRLLNTFRPTTIKAAKGDDGPFLDFMRYLIPDEGDRNNTLRWCATLIARPAIKMSYGVLLVSERQEVGKSTLGEAILGPLVGKANVSTPNEQQITDSSFNGWIAHKRLAVVHEIYAGHSSKAYNRLKSEITDETVRVNEKNVKEYDLDVWVHIFACSNSLKALKLDDEDRRWLVPGVTEVLQPDTYWRAFHSWLKDQGGLGIIRRWADEFLTHNEPVLRGQHAPGTTRKTELIQEGRSDCYKLALDLARGIAARTMEQREKGEVVTKVVVAVEDVRQWTADELGLRVNDWRVDKGAAILKALKEGGLVAPASRPGEGSRRFNITPRTGRKIKSHVAANFDIGPGDEWESIKAHYREREDLGPF